MTLIGMPSLGRCFVTGYIIAKVPVLSFSDILHEQENGELDENISLQCIQNSLKTCRESQSKGEWIECSHTIIAS